MTRKKLFLLVITLIATTSIVFSNGESDIKSRLNDYDIKFRMGPSENKNLAKRMIAQITDIKV